MDQPSADSKDDPFQRLVRAFRDPQPSEEGSYFSTVPMWIIAAQVFLVMALVAGATVLFALN